MAKGKKEIKRKSRGKTPTPSWTTKEIKIWIRERTREVQEQVKEFQNLEKKGREGLFFRKSVKELQKAATGKTRNDMNVPVGNMTKKSDLLAQAKKLAAFGKRKSVKQIGRKVDIQKVYNELDEEDRRLADDYSLKEKVKSGSDLKEEISVIKQVEYEERLKRLNEQEEYDYTKYQLGDDGLTNSDRDYLMDIGEYDNYLNEQKTESPYEDDKKERAYQTFKQNYDQSLTRDEYDRLIDVFGAIGSYLSSFGYERDAGDSRPKTNMMFIGNIQDYVREGDDAMSIYWAVREVIERSKGQGWTPMRIMQELDELLADDEE